ncbi:MAG: DUF1543 domain-containing protein [Deltaproteobacteria bacterium]|nr:DUF1543 domain-containing protein [Deltaproteobacteria bacterium]
MKLFLVHCGFYDQKMSDEKPNIFEGHHNFYVAAKDRHEAKEKAKQKSLYIAKGMHIDGIHEIDVVDGYQVILEKTSTAGNVINVTGYDEAEKI